MTDFDFDEWAELYKTDILEFERRRKELLEDAIQQAPIRQRNMLRILQSECDAIHEANTPIDATVEISKMMIERLGRLTEPLTELRSIDKGINHK